MVRGNAVKRKSKEKSKRTKLSIHSKIKITIRREENWKNEKAKLNIKARGKIKKERTYSRYEHSLWLLLCME